MDSLFRDFKKVGLETKKEIGIPTSFLDFSEIPYIDNENSCSADCDFNRRRLNDTVFADYGTGNKFVSGPREIGDDFNYRFDIFGFGSNHERRVSFL